MADEQPPGWEVPTSNYQFGDGEVSIRVGELYGLRTFGLTDDGWLTGVMYPEPWTPDVNVAKCWQITGWSGEGGAMGVADHVPYRVRTNTTDQYPAEFSWTMRNEDGDIWLSATEPVVVRGNQDDPDHDLGECGRCGLHGYLEGSLDYGWRPGTVSGVVRAWGRIALGNRGFRAQYARVVGLYIPDGDVDTAGGFRMATVPGYWTWGMSWGETKRYDPAPEVLDLVRKRYGALPVFRSLTELLEKFPTTPPPSREDKPKEIEQ